MLSEGGLNLYGYVGNRPMRSVDPLGLWGLGLFGSAQATAGNLMASAHAEGSYGVGIFTESGAKGGLGVGGYVSHGESIGPGGMLSPQSKPCDDEPLNPAVGASASIGAGYFFTTANRPQDLANTKYNLNITLGYGPLQFGVDIGFGGGGPLFLGVSPPAWGATLGASASLQHTSTIAGDARSNLTGE